MTQTPDLALVTGARRGIGAAIADGLEQIGWRVLRIDRGYSPSDRLQDVALDVANHAEVAALVARAEAEIGPIGALVNCAGITRDGFLHKMDPATQWAPVIEVNLTGAFNTCREVVPLMRARRYGRIINIASMNGLRGQMGQVNYSAAKSGLIGMTRSLAMEVAAFGITANCIAPGFIDTDMTRAMREDVREVELAKVPMGRAGRPEEIAGLVSYLASDIAGFVTGQTISINGGQLMP